MFDWLDNGGVKILVEGLFGLDASTGWGGAGIHFFLYMTLSRY